MKFGLQEAIDMILEGLVLVAVMAAAVMLIYVIGG